MSFKERYQIVSTLGKFSISFPVGFTAFLGYVVVKQAFDIYSLAVFAGIFLLSSAASLLNQIQEHKIDALMRRTSKRPLPSALLSLGEAGVIGGIFFILGCLILYFVNLEALFWGIMGLVWYNFIYTPLKRVTAFSVFPGAVVGAIPPIAGWMAAGGEFWDINLLLFAFFFFIGQMPHFWLLVIKYGDQYSDAGLPSLTKLFSIDQIMRINMVWLWASFVSAFFFTVSKLIQSPIVSILLIVSTLVMMVWALYITFFDARTHEQKIRPMFIYFNSYYLWVMMLFILDVLI